MDSWVKIHGYLIGIEQICRIIDQEDLESLNTVIMLLFQLPTDKLAFRYISTEIIEDLSFALKDKKSDGTYHT